MSESTPRQKRVMSLCKEVALRQTFLAGWQACIDHVERPGYIRIEDDRLVLGPDAALNSWADYYLVDTKEVRVKQVDIGLLKTLLNLSLSKSDTSCMDSFTIRAGLLQEILDELEERRSIMDNGSSNPGEGK